MSTAHKHLNAAIALATSARRKVAQAESQLEQLRAEARRADQYATQLSRMVGKLYGAEQPATLASESCTCQGEVVAVS